MGTRNLRKPVYIGAAILMFGVLLVMSLIFAHHVPMSNDDLQIVDVLLPARESRPMLYLGEAPYKSDDFMIIQQSRNRRAITEAISDSVPDPGLIDHDCGILDVTIDVDRNLWLNTLRMGTLNDTAPLASKLTDLFNERIAQRAYLVGMEKRTDLPDIERIPRTILLRPSRSVTSGDVIRLIQLLKELRADPIGLQINHLPA